MCSALACQVSAGLHSCCRVFSSSLCQVSAVFYSVCGSYSFLHEKRKSKFVFFFFFFFFSFFYIYSVVLFVVVCYLKVEKKINEFLVIFIGAAC